MKEKTKNILKGLGIGAIACVGMFTFTGCSIDLNQAQIDKLMYAVDNSQNFMENTLHLLENQNAKIDANQAHSLAKHAYTKILLNQNGIRNNLVFKNYQDGELAAIITSYADEDTDVIIADSVDINSVWYASEGSNYYYHKQSNTKEELDVDSIHADFSWASWVNVINWARVTENDILFCNILSNGNYEITYSVNTINHAQLEDGAHAFIIVAEITKDANFVKISMDSAGYVEASDQIMFGIKTYAEFEYGTANMDYINQMLAEAKACPVNQ